MVFVVGMIGVSLLASVMGLSLLPFFEFFSRDAPHRLAAIAELESAMPPELLQEDAAWIEVWRTSGIDQSVYMRQYFSQHDNPEEPNRSCFSSAAAMVAAHWGKVESDDEYIARRQKFGDTTSVQAHIETLESFGLYARFIPDADNDVLEIEIEAGRPVLAGYWHEGNLLKGEWPRCDGDGCGHWLVVTGFQGKHSSNPHWQVSDPAGKPLMSVGGHDKTVSGHNVMIRQAAFYQRWQALGPGTGWAILVDQ